MRIKYMLLLGLMFLFTDCQKDNLSIQEENLVVESVSNHIPGEEAPDVVNYLDRLFNTSSLKHGDLILPFDKNLIDKKTIAEVKDPETGYTNFTFAVKRKKKDNFLFQVVVTKYGKNDFSDPYIFQFRFDDAFRKKLNKGEADWSEYIWPIYPYSLSDAAEALSKDLPCPGIGSGGGGGESPSGPSGGSSPSGGIPDTGGNSGDVDECYYQWEEDEDGNVVIEISCDGPFIMVLMGDGDCPNPPEAPIGVIEPEEDEEPFNILDNLIDNVNTHISINSSLENWLRAHPIQLTAVSDFLDRKPHLSSEAKALTVETYRILHQNDSSFSEFEQEWSAMPSFLWPFVKEIGKEVAVELFKKLAKKYSPAGQIGDVIDAVDALSEGEMLDFFGEVWDIVSKKFPALVVADVIYDGSTLFARAKPVWDAVQRLEKFGGDVVEKLLKTIKDTGGNIMDKFKFVGGNTGLSLSDVGSADGFFDNLQNAISEQFDDLEVLPLTQLAPYELAGFKFNNGAIRISIKEGGNTHQGYTLEIKRGSQNSLVKIRIF